MPFSIANREGCVFLRNNGSPFSKPPHQLSCLPSLLSLGNFSPWPCPPPAGIPNPAYSPKRDPQPANLPFLAPCRPACAITSSRAVGTATSPALAGTGSMCTSTMNSQCGGGSKALVNVTNNL